MMYLAMYEEVERVASFQLPHVSPLDAKSRAGMRKPLR
jgi:hypothetical protein